MSKNRKVPEWKQDFQTIGVQTLLDAGFGFIQVPEEDGRTTVVRKQGILSMYIEQDHTAGPQHPITVQWMYVTDSIKPKNLPKPTCVDMTKLLWEAIVHGRMSNSSLLLMSDELTDRRAAIMDARETRRYAEAS